ncbi:MAG: hypothetical protein M1817_005642 [Caeruleum heppii]|nr:MAG: hypothetical protein M1817_005642 [Caeruleum heppii]
MSAAEYEAMLADQTGPTTAQEDIVAASPVQIETRFEASDNDPGRREAQSLAKQSDLAGIGLRPKKRRTQKLGNAGRDEEHDAPGAIGQVSDDAKNQSARSRGKVSRTKLKLSFAEDELSSRKSNATLNENLHFRISPQTMLCAISGEAPQSPVASRRSGHVFERRLIESYITEHGKDPVTGEELSADDLIELHSARVVRPRPPTLTSIPSLLSVFQTEWDATALEAYNLRQQLAQTRQELSTALYQHDAAVRVIARLNRERDAAREALSKITVTSSGPSNNGEPMQVDGEGLSTAIAATVDATQERLSKTRRKRTVPTDWATAELLGMYKPTQISEALFSGAASLALDASGDLILTGGKDGVAGVYSISQSKLVQSFGGVSGTVTDVLWWGSRAVLSTTSGQVRIFDQGSELIGFDSHAGRVAAIALHPSGELLASVGVDKSFVLYDLSELKMVTQIYTDSDLTTASFHPDGHILAAGSDDGRIRVFNVKTGVNAANLDSKGRITALSFSENGTWLAASRAGQTTIEIWDLRKSAQIKQLEIGSDIESLQWDYTGQFIAAAGSSGIAVQAYSKSSKEWSESLRAATPAVAISWGPRAQSVVSIAAQGALTLLGPR